MQGWLNRTVLLQRRFHPEGLPREGTEEWRKYIEYNALAVMIELGEFLREVECQPWKVSRVKDRRKAVEEIVDVLHSVANLLVALEVDDDEIDHAYDHKMQVNFERLITGRSLPVGRDSHPVYGRNES